MPLLANVVSEVSDDGSVSDVVASDTNSCGCVAHDAVDWSVECGTLPAPVIGHDFESPLVSY